MFTSFALNQDRLLLCFFTVPFSTTRSPAFLPTLDYLPKRPSLTVLNVFKSDAFFFKVHIMSSFSFPFFCCLMITFVCIAFHLSVLNSFSLLKSNLNSHYLLYFTSAFKTKTCHHYKELRLSVSYCAVFSNQYPPENVIFLLFTQKRLIHLLLSG